MRHTLPCDSANSSSIQKLTYQALETRQKEADLLFDNKRDQPESIGMKRDI